MRTRIGFGVLGLSVVLMAGCASSRPDSSTFAQIDEFVVDAAFSDAWDSTKAALRARDMIIYTRDTRGLFVAYTNPQRRRLVPHRTQLTVNLTEITPDSTRIAIETLDQVYGVTVLTYPGWHARPTEETPETDGVVDAIHRHLAGESLDPVEEIDPATSAD